MKYPGKDLAEKAMRPAAHSLAQTAVTSALLSAVGWWQLRQSASRAELVALRVCSERTSYRHEAMVEKLFGKPLAEVTQDDILRWIELTP